eukprot:364892-Chlamydomonas_euryale.AAC.6
MLIAHTYWAEIVVGSRVHDVDFRQDRLASGPQPRSCASGERRGSARAISNSLSIRQDWSRHSIGVGYEVQTGQQAQRSPHAPHGSRRPLLHVRTAVEHRFAAGVSSRLSSTSAGRRHPACCSVR